MRSWQAPAHVHGRTRAAGEPKTTCLLESSRRAAADPARATRSDVRSPRTPASTPPQRRRRARHHHHGLACWWRGCIIGALSAVGYVVGIANSAPDLSSLKPQDPGRSRRVYAPTARRLGDHPERRPAHADRRRRRSRRTSATRRSRSRTSASTSTRASTSRASSAPRSRTSTSGKTMQGGSTLTMQLIRTLYTGDREKTLKRKIREAKLAEELENVHPGTQGQGVDPHEVPQLRALRHQRRPDGGRHPGRRARVLRQAGLAAHARRGRAARRPAAGAERSTTRSANPAARDRAPQRGAAARWPTHGYITAGQAAAGASPRRWSCITTATSRQQARELLLRLRHRRAHQAVRP